MIKEYSWTNDDGFKVEDEHCFDMVKIKSEQTIEFNANSSTPANDDQAHYFAASIELFRFTKDGELIKQVADSISAEAVDGEEVNIQSTLVYK